MTASIRAATEQSIGHHAIYLVGATEDVQIRRGDNVWRRPVRFGITANPRNILSQARSWNWSGVELLGLWWAPSLTAAEAIRSAVAAEIERYAEWRHGAWHDVSHDAFELWIRHTASNRGIVIFDEDERQARIEAAVEEAILDMRRARARMARRA